MIRTSNYIIAKKRGNKWIPAKEYCPDSKQYRCVETYSLTDAKEVLGDMRNGDIPGHSGKCKYRIMEICYCHKGLGNG